MAYIISVPKGKNRIEIIPSVCLKQSFLKHTERIVVGRASTKEEANLLAAKLLTEAYRNGSLADFFLKIGKEEGV